MAISFVAAGTVSATNGSAPTPGLPAGVQAGDVMVAVFYSRETIDGTVSVSAGWNQALNDRSSGGLLGVWTRAWQSGDAAPTFTLGGHATGNSGDTAIARIFAFRGMDTTTPVAGVGTVGNFAASQNIGAIAGFTLDANDAVLVIGGKADDWTSVATLSGDGLTWAEDADNPSTLGLDAGLVVDHAINGASQVTVTSKTFTVTGGLAGASKGVMVALNVAPVPVSADRRVVYNVLNSVTADRRVVYDVQGLSAVTADRRVVYNLLNTTTVDRRVVYSVLNSVTASRRVVYNIVNVVQAGRTVKYDVLNTVTANRRVVYQIFQVATSDRRVVYSVFAAIQADRRVVYAISSGNGVATNGTVRIGRRPRIYVFSSQ